MQTGSIITAPQITADPAASRAAERLRQSADGFEALFLNEMLKAGRTTSFADDLTESSATQTSRAMLDTVLAERSAGNAGLGLSDAIYRQFANHLAPTKG
ncbi:MAG: rod-binding protein [Loktanella sp.]|nr:rod-binding protein [Loktanella sp.]